MKRLLVIVAAVGLIFTGIFGLQTATGVASGGDKILEFDTMVGVMGPFVGGSNPNPNPSRGVNGGGLPWVIAEANGELRDNGDLEVEVEGLVLGSVAMGVPADKAGTNPAPFFRAIVSCLSIDGGGKPTTVNVITAPFPANANGDSEIEDNIALPSPCIAPIIFVTSPGGSWFSATGN